MNGEAGNSWKFKMFKRLQIIAIPEKTAEIMSVFLGVFFSLPEKKWTLQRKKLKRTISIVTEKIEV